MGHPECHIQPYEDPNPAVLVGRRGGWVDSVPVAPDSVWEIVFLMVILKIPIVYLCSVVYYAIKAEPRPEAGAGVTARTSPEDTGGGWRRPRRRVPWRPHGGPVRTYPRSPRVARAYAEKKR
jgi:hypothetical protein